METSAGVSPFRYRYRSSEDLPRLSRLAYDASKIHCGVCRDFHVMWPYLRSRGINGAGPEYNWPLHVDILSRAAAGRENVRWFLAGSADAGLLAVTADAAERHPARSHDFTVVDLCGTPVALCEAHAATRGLTLSASVGDLSSYRPERPFDVVLMHQLLYFVAPPARLAFLKHSAGWLVPGGQLYLTVSVDMPGTASRPGRSSAMIAWREAAIRADAASGALDLPEDMDAFLARLRGMRGIRPDSYAEPASVEVYAGLLASAGLVVDAIIPMPNEPGQMAPARDETGHIRYMLVARAPG